jgi:hypothetical protein
MLFLKRKLKRIPDMTRVSQLIENAVTSKKYSLFIPNLKMSRRKERTVTMKELAKTHRIDFCSLSPTKTGAMNRNERLIRIKAISSMAMKIPCGLN